MTICFSDRYKIRGYIVHIPTEFVVTDIHLFFVLFAFLGVASVGFFCGVVCLFLFWVLLLLGFGFLPFSLGFFAAVFCLLGEALLSPRLSYQSIYISLF